MTLTQAATITKRFIVFTIAAVLIGTTSLIGYRIWYAQYIASLPPVEEKPDTRFGLLSEPKLPASTVSSSNFSYSIDTVTGNLPELKKIAKVFFIPQGIITLLSADRSKSIAEKLKVYSEPEILSDTQYRYISDSKSLLVNIDTGNFVFSKLSSDSAQLESININRATQDFKTLLSSFGILPEELQSGTAKAFFLNGNLEPTEDPLEAQAVEISLWPAYIDELPIITPAFRTALIKAIANGPTHIIDNYNSIDFTYWPIDLTTFATYPIKTANQAFEELQAGKGVIVVENNQPRVSITSAYLAYYQQAEYTPYMQPIIIFEGPNFVAYVTAIMDQYLSTDNLSTNP